MQPALHLHLPRNLHRPRHHRAGHRQILLSQLLHLCVIARRDLRMRPLEGKRQQQFIRVTGQPGDDVGYELSCLGDAKIDLLS